MAIVCTTIQEALEGIRDGASVMAGGFGLVGIPEKLIQGLRERAELVHRCACETWNDDRRCSKVASIGRQRIARCPCFGRQHVEEPVDQREVVRGHVLDSASAAIIRAANCCPLRLSAVVRWNR